MQRVHVYLLTAALLSSSVMAAEARTCKPVAYGLYSVGHQTDGSAPLEPVPSDAVGKQRAIAEWRKYVRKNVGFSYASWRFARSPGR